MDAPTDKTANDAETLIATAELRWHNGVLEQLFRGWKGTEQWVPVPEVND